MYIYDGMVFSLKKEWNPAICNNMNGPGGYYAKWNSESEVKSLSRVRLFATPWTVAYQAPQSMDFSRQEYWSGLPFPSPQDLPDDPGNEPRSPALRADALPSELSGKLSIMWWALREFRLCPVSTPQPCTHPQWCTLRGLRMGKPRTLVPDSRDACQRNDSCNFLYIEEP